MCGDVLYVGLLSVVFYGCYCDEVIVIKRLKLWMMCEIDWYYVELGFMFEARYENVLGVVGARAASSNYELFFLFMENGVVDEVVYE